MYVDLTKPEPSLRFERNDWDAIAWCRQIPTRAVKQILVHNDLSALGYALARKA